MSIQQNYILIIHNCVEFIDKNDTPIVVINEQSKKNTSMEYGYITRSFDVLSDLRLNKRLSKQSWGWWFETPSRHYDVIVMMPWPHVPVV